MTAYVGEIYNIVDDVQEGEWELTVVDYQREDKEWISGDYSHASVEEAQKAVDALRDDDWERHKRKIMRQGKRPIMKRKRYPEADQDTTDEEIEKMVQKVRADLIRDREKEQQKERQEEQEIPRPEWPKYRIRQFVLTIKNKEVETSGATAGSEG